MWSKNGLVDREGRTVYSNFIVQGPTFTERKVVLVDYNGGNADQTLTGASIMAGTLQINNIVGNANLKMPTAEVLNQAMSSFAPPLTGVPPVLAATALAQNAGSPTRGVRFTVINPDGADTVTLIASTAGPTNITVGVGSMAVAPNTTATFEVLCVNNAGTYAYTVNRL